MLRSLVATAVMLVFVACKGGGDDDSASTSTNGERLTPENNATCASISSGAESAADQVRQQNLACSTDDDCEVVNLSSDCFDACTRAMAKSGQGAFDASIASVNSAQ